MAANQEIFAAWACLYFWCIYWHIDLYFELKIQDSTLSEQSDTETTSTDDFDI